MCKLDLRDYKILNVIEAAEVYVCCRGNRIINSRWYSGWIHTIYSWIKGSGDSKSIMFSGAIADAVEDLVKHNGDDVRVVHFDEVPWFSERSDILDIGQIIESITRQQKLKVHVYVFEILKGFRKIDYKPKGGVMKNKYLPNFKEHPQIVLYEPECIIPVVAVEYRTENEKMKIIELVKRELSNVIYVVNEKFVMVFKEDDVSSDVKEIVIDDINESELIKEIDNAIRLAKEIWG